MKQKVSASLCGETRTYPISQDDPTSVVTEIGKLKDDGSLVNTRHEVAVGDPLDTDASNALASTIQSLRELLAPESPRAVRQHKGWRWLGSLTHRPRTE